MVVAAPGSTPTPSPTATSSRSSADRPRTVVTTCPEAMAGSAGRKHGWPTSHGLSRPPSEIVVPARVPLMFMGILTCHDPGEMYLWSLLFLIVALGLCLIAISEANLNHHHGWALYFVINA